ncbi:MAG: hypothetical protein ACK41U_11345 [Paracoccus sp. (in: a-proteobacteria)]|uniref:hypothetical protein n=1 Tax=Paracoccus sp. TaxID=267 RepID=UPI00391A2E6C
MPPFDSLIGVLSSRSFSTIWFWLALIGMWSAAGRTVLGVPAEVLTRARTAIRRGEAEGAPVITLLDWLSLTLPRWRLGPREGAIFLAVTSFLLTSLAIMGFGFGLELAQALTLVGLPFWLLFWMRVRLARRLVPLLAAAQEGQTPLAEAAAGTLRHMTRHRLWVTLLSMAAVLVTLLWGMLWVLLHPFGI